MQIHKTSISGPEVIALTILVVCLIISTAVPLIYFVFDSLQPSATGLRGIEAAWSDSDVHSAILRSIVFCLICTSLQIGLGGLVGVWGVGTPRRRAFTPLLALPLFVGPAFCALMWKLVLDPVNGLPGYLQQLGPSAILDWTSDATAAFAVLIFVQVWMWGFVTGAILITLYGPNTKTASGLFTLDGARSIWGAFAALWYTQREWIFVMVVFLLVENLRSFEVTYILTRGGPGTATTTLQWLIFQSSFVTMDYPKSSALALTMTVLLIPIAFLVARVVAQRNHDA
jgi:multiple sugar transport system permease protein